MSRAICAGCVLRNDLRRTGGNAPIQRGGDNVSTAHLDAIMELSQARAEAYIHLAKGMILNNFGPATEHSHTEISVALATAMMQHEGSQIIADAFRTRDT